MKDWLINKLYDLIRLINRVEINRMGAKIRSNPHRKNPIGFTGNQYRSEFELGFQRSGCRLIFDLGHELTRHPTVLMIPVGIGDLNVLFQRNREGKSVVFPVPSPQSVKVLNDKVLFLAFMRSHSFASYLPADEIGGKYPCMLKKRISEGGTDCYLIPTLEERNNYLDKISDPQFFLQEFIPGSVEYAAHLMVNDGSILRSLTVKYHFSHPYPIKFKDTPILKYRCRKRYLPLFNSVLNAIHFEGLCCINYKIRRGKVVILEINPRLGASASAYLPFLIQDFL